MRINQNANNAHVNTRNTASPPNINRSNRPASFQGTNLSSADKREGVDFNVSISNRAQKLLRMMGAESMRDVSAMLLQQEQAYRPELEFEQLHE
jgi:hypothetical protein